MKLSGTFVSCLCLLSSVFVWLFRLTMVAALIQRLKMLSSEADLGASDTHLDVERRTSEAGGSIQHSVRDELPNASTYASIRDLLSPSQAGYRNSSLISRSQSHASNLLRFRNVTTGRVLNPRREGQ